MDTNTPLLGVGMPVYNGGRFLEPALDSLLAQTFDDFELVISDNASTDHTEEVCRRVAAEDPRVRYVRQSRNLGANPNFNAVRRLARGKYFKWASANDLCAPTFFAECVEVLEERRDVVVCYPRTRLIDEEDEPIEDYGEDIVLEEDSPVSRFTGVVDRLALNNVFNGVMRARALEAVGEMKQYLGSDLPLMAGLALRGKFHQVPEYLFFRRMGPESQTTIRKARGDTDDYHYDERQTMLKQYVDYFDVVLRAPLSLGDKARLVGALLRRANWHRRILANDIVRAIGPRAAQEAVGRMLTRRSRRDDRG